MLLNLESLVDKYNLRIGGVIHIGAHYGEEDAIYQKMNIRKKIYFEPLTKNFNILKKTVTPESILYNLALGSEEKMVDMYVETANNGQSSSILKPDIHLKQYPHIVFNGTERVPMKTLDSLSVSSTYNFINIDVQGYELEVFKGSTKTLKGIDVIMSEINRDSVYENCARVEDLVKFLKPYGFILVEEYWAGITWGDGLFIKN